MLEKNFEVFRKLNSPANFSKFLGESQISLLSRVFVVVLTKVGALDGKSKVGSFIGASKKNHRGIFFSQSLVGLGRVVLGSKGQDHSQCQDQSTGHSQSTELLHHRNNRRDLRRSRLRRLHQGHRESKGVVPVFWWKSV